MNILRFGAAQFGAARFIATNGDDLKQWVPQQNYPRAMDMIGEQVNAWNDVFAQSLATLPDNILLECSFSRSKQMGDGSFGAVASNAELVRVFEKDENFPGGRKPFAACPQFIRDLGGWDTCGSAEYNHTFVDRIVSRIQQALNPQADEEL